MARERPGAHDARPVATRQRNAGNAPGATKLAAEKFGVDKATVRRALAEPRKAPEPITDHSGVPGGWTKRMKEESAEPAAVPSLTVAIGNRLVIGGIEG